MTFAWYGQHLTGCSFHWCPGCEPIPDADLRNMLAPDERPPLPTTEGWHADPDGLTYWITERGVIEPGTRHYPEGEMSLTEFLLARIADRESLARDMQHQAATGRPLLELRGGGTPIRELVNPALVLAECESKRKIVEGHVETLHPSATDYFRGLWASEDQTIKLLATAYATHPDYRDEWRP